MKTLQTHSALFYTLAKTHGLDTRPIQEAAAIPMFVGDSQRDVDLSQTLVNCGTLASPIGYPAVTENTARLRFLESCTHCKDHIRTTVKAIAECLGGP